MQLQDLHRPKIPEATQWVAQPQPLQRYNPSGSDPNEGSQAEGRVDDARTREQTGPSQATTIAKKKNPPKNLETKRLPDIADIQKAIPQEGIELKNLAAKFSRFIDQTNVNLFAKIVQELGELEMKIMVHPLSRAPDLDRIAELTKEAITPSKPRPVLLVNQPIKSALQAGVTITFSEPEELLRGESDVLLPKNFYRVDYEQSATPSAYTAKHNRVKHRQLSRPRLHGSNAFQSLEAFNGEQDLTRLRIERHLIWNKKADPSSYISAFGAFIDGQAHMGERITIAVIDTQDLVPITIRGKLRETIVSTWKNREPTFEIVEREVQIPAWVHKSARPENQSPISLQQLTASGADMWLSIRELRHCNLKVPATKGHWAEWLACGVIPKWRVSDVWPYDGKIVHCESKERLMCVVNSTENWIFDWSQQMWILGTLESLKRRRRAESIEDSDTDPESTPRKRQQTLPTQQDNEMTSETGCAQCRNCPCRKGVASSTTTDEDDV